MPNTNQIRHTTKIVYKPIQKPGGKIVYVFALPDKQPTKIVA